MVIYLQALIPGMQTGHSLGRLKVPSAWHVRLREGFRKGSSLNTEPSAQIQETFCPTGIA